MTGVLQSYGHVNVKADFIIIQVSADWSGTGVLQCYGHVNVEADFGEGKTKNMNGCFP